MPDFDDIPPEKMKQIAEEMQKRRFAGMTPEQIEEKKKRDEIKKKENIARFDDTVNICENGYYKKKGIKTELELTHEEMESVRVFLPDDIPNCETENVEKSLDCAYGCHNADSLSVAKKMTEEGKRVLVLNMASSSRPGGATIEGADGQEEALCRKSSLYKSIGNKNASSYYEYGKSLNTRLGSDAVMISPYVSVFRDAEEELLDAPFIISVLSCSAPMIRLGLEGKTEEEYEKMLYDRICKMLSCAAHLGHKNLVLGAFGCGVFGNDANVVAKLFHNALTGPYNRFFETVNFAILCKDKDDYNYTKFCEYFA